jgi:ribonuclease HI
VKSRQSNSGRKSRAAFILEALAEKLPDHILQEYFRDISADQVRKTLLDTAETLGPVTKDQVIPSRTKAPKNHAKGKDWSGKLKGMALHLYTDGASRGNPGEAGAGITILDEQGHELVGTGKYLGKCTNNEAEYRALLLGLDKCGEFGQGRLKAHLDSELIVKQILGEYRVKHPNLKPLFKETMQRLSGFVSFSITHVRREKNSRADQLANQAIDNHINK